MALTREEWEARKAAAATTVLSKEDWERKKRMAALAQSKANIAADAESYRATTDMGKTQRFLAGAGSGLTNAARNMANMVGIEKIGDFDTSDEGLAKQDEADADLLSTGMGSFGNIVGGAAATAPLGMGAGALVGAGARGLSTITNVARLEKALAAAGNARRLGGAVVQGATQGATEGAILGGPGNRVGGAVTGGALGGAVPAVAAGVGKVGKFLAKDRRSEAAQALQKEMDVTSRDLGGVGPTDAVPDGSPLIPASHALKPGMLKQIYEGFVSNIPGSSGRLRGQYDEAVGGLRETAVRMAAPDDAVVASIFQHGDDFPKSLGLLKEAWDDTLDYVNKSVIDIPTGFFPKSLQRQLNEFKIKLPQGRVNGKALTMAKTDIQGLIDNLPKGPLGRTQRASLNATKEQIDTLIKNQLPTDEALKWADDLKKYKNFETLMSAAGTAPGTSLFTPKSLAAKASRRAGRKGLYGEGGPLQDLGRLGQEVLPNFPSRAGIFQTLAAAGAAQGLAGGVSDNKGLMGSGLMTVLLPFAAARGMSNRVVQRKIMEGLKSPKVMQELVDQFPEAATAIRRYTTQLGVAKAEQE